MGVGSIQGYTGEEFKNENSKEVEDNREDGDEEINDIGDVFFRVKQENLHVPEGYPVGSGVWYRCSRRWKRE